MIYSVSQSHTNKSQFFVVTQDNQTYDLKCFNLVIETPPSTHYTDFAELLTNLKPSQENVQTGIETVQKGVKAVMEMQPSKEQVDQGKKVAETGVKAAFSAYSYLKDAVSPRL